MSDQPGEKTQSCTAFQGVRCIGSGTLRDVALAAKRASERQGQEAILIFDDATSRPVEIDLRGTEKDVLDRLGNPLEGGGQTAISSDLDGVAPRGPGRPKLGVVAREVTLLPRHWEWLSSQPGGASVALRKLVEEARRASQDKDRVRQAQEAAYRFMSAMAGDQPGYEEATRALYAGDRARFDALIEPWPADIRAHTSKVAAAAF